MTTTVDHRTRWLAYAELWSVREGAHRRSKTPGLLADGCVYTDPTVQTAGWDELDTYMDDFQRNVPGGGFVTTSFLDHHDRSLACWNMVDAEGTTLGTGTSYGTYDENGELTSMTGFFDPTPDGQPPPTRRHCPTGNHQPRGHANARRAVTDPRRDPP